LEIFNAATIVTFMLILFRVSGLMMTAPLFNTQGIPVQTKIWFSFALTFLLFPFHSQHFNPPTEVIPFALVGAQEVILGLMLGFVADLLFVGIQMAGELISVQMGMSVSSILDPISGIQVPVIGQMLFYFAMLIFLSLNVHHTLILALDHSFDLLPLGHFFSNTGAMAERFIVLVSDMASIALLVGAPIMAVLLVSDVALAFMAKVMPQMNIFVVGMPIKIAAGLMILAISIPYVNAFLENRYVDMYGHLRVLYNH